MLLNPSSFRTTGALGDLSIRVMNDYANKMAALKLFIPHMVSKTVGKFYQMSRDHMKLRDLTAPSGAEAKTAKYSAFTTSYELLEKAVRHLVLEKDARDFDVAVADLDSEAALQNMDAIMLEIEDAAHTLATTSTNYPSASVVTLTNDSDRWTDSDGDPRDDVTGLAQEIFENSGARPNIMVVSQRGLDALLDNANIVDRLKYTSAERSAAIVARLLGLEQIVVSDLAKNTANDGAADSTASVWGDDAVLAFVNPNAGLKGMTYGKCFIGQDFYVKTIDAPELGRSLGAHYVESGMEYALKQAAVMSSSDSDFAAGALIENIF